MGQLKEVSRRAKTDDVMRLDRCYARAARGDVSDAYLAVSCIASSGAGWHRWQVIPCEGMHPEFVGKGSQLIPAPDVAGRKELLASISRQSNACKYHADSFE